MTARQWYYRTEDIKPEEILKYFVDLNHSRKIIDVLKDRSPVVLRGSRGVGKSFAMRVAEQELEISFTTDRILPVYVKFERAQLVSLGTEAEESFLPWMISKICSKILRALQRKGIFMPAGTALSTYAGREEAQSTMDRIMSLCETAWRKKDLDTIDDLQVPGPDELKDAIEDLCRSEKIDRIVLLIDEAAHVFVPAQQRQFFTLMRDLRSPYISVKAAVYPGATSYGDSFQPVHDSTEIVLDRSITEAGYANSMRNLVLRQNPDLTDPIVKNGGLFDTLAFAATGNPRILLKTVSTETKFNSTNIDNVIKRHYREEIWSEHSDLGSRYPGHKELIDWGRNFVENSALKSLYARNKDRTSETSSYIWIHRDCPNSVKSALRLLCYSGILQEHQSGVRGTRSEPGTRYTVNFGCQIALDANPISYGESIRHNLSVKRMIEYGANHDEFSEIRDFSSNIDPGLENAALIRRLEADVGVLDLTNFQVRSIRSIGKNTVGQVIDTDEHEFKKAKYVATVRARQIKNAAQAAVFEYLSG